MRHILSIVISIICAPIIYILTGVGMVKFGENAGPVAAGQGNNWTDIGVAAGAIVVAGALWAVLTMVRMSPLGPLIAALVLIGVEIFGLQDPADLIKMFGTSVMGVSGAAEAPLNGPALLMAIPMLATIFSPRRWRGREKVLLAPATYPSYNAGPSYPEPTSAAPNYPTPDGTYVPSTDPYVPATEPTMPFQTTAETAGDTQIVTDEAKSEE